MPEAEPEAGEHLGQRGRQHDLRERREPGEAKHFGDVPVILRDGANPGHRVQDRWPHRADGDREQRRGL